ncbi:MAG: hypothetical protein GEU86_18875 [Actinophytocola sp.]|nr:hypothetical protein [Actinophytocola sp.]
MCSGCTWGFPTANWLVRGAAVVVTLGAAGAFAASRAAEVTRPAVAVPVVDTVGAGDAFTAADRRPEPRRMAGRRRAEPARIQRGGVNGRRDRFRHAGRGRDLRTSRSGSADPRRARLPTRERSEEGPSLRWRPGVKRRTEPARGTDGGDHRDRHRKRQATRGRGLRPRVALAWCSVSSWTGTPAR